MPWKQAEGQDIASYGTAYWLSDSVKTYSFLNADIESLAADA